MRIRRTTPPTAAPILPMDLLHGFLGLLSGGKNYLNRLDREIKDRFGVKHAFFVSSGKAALALILLALRQQYKKTQVVIPAYTCFSVPSSVVKAGLDIVSCDIDPITFDFDYACLEKIVTDATLCVLAVHLFGIPADLDRIKAVCRKKNAYLIEDAAQAMGGQLKGRMLGTIGDVGFYSLGRGKNINCGSGGIIVTNNDTLAAALTRHGVTLPESSFADDLRNLLQVSLMSLLVRPWIYWLPASLPFLKLGQTIFYTDFPIYKLSGRRAALLQNWRDHLEESNRVRSQNSLKLSTEIGQTEAHGRGIPYLRLPILVQDRHTRDLLYHCSQANGLGLSRMYPTPVNEIDELKTAFSGQAFPGAKRVAETLLTLPTHHLLNARDKNAIGQLLRCSAKHEEQKALTSTVHIN